jgi:hypothetical protein
MTTFTRNKKIVVSSIIAVALIMVISVSFVYAQTPDMTNVKTWNAQGNQYQKIDNSTIKYYPASFSLNIQHTVTNGTVRRFDVVGGTLTLNGVTYTITSGNGGVLTGRHIILLQAQGATADGQTVTLKLAARYIWAGGQTFNVRIEAKVQIGTDTPYVLLLKSTIQPTAPAAPAT